MIKHAPRAVLEYEILGEEKKVILSEPFKNDILYRVLNKEKKIVKSGRIDFGSCVGNFAEILNYALCNVANSTNLRRTSNVAASGNVHSVSVKEGALSTPTASSYGIWIGNRTGNPGVDLTGVLSSSLVGGDINYSDYDLSIRLKADGDATSEVDTDIVYSAVSITFDDGALKVTRSFSNNRITPIRISEIGLVGKSSSSEYFLIARDKVNDGSNAWIEVEDGQIIEFDYMFEAEASGGLVINFLRMLSSEWNAGASVENLQDINGTSVSVNFTTARTQKDVIAALANDNFGILVGGHVGATSPTTYALDRYGYKLQKKISNTYLTHGTTSALNTSAVSNSNGYSIFGVQRDFTNVSTSYDAKIYEIGLFVKETANSRYFMISRLLASGSGGVDYLTVPPGKIMRIKYYLAFPLEETELVL